MDSGASYPVWSVPPEIRNARSGGVNVAYQIAGEGAEDMLFIPGWVTHLALDWHEPRWVGWFERMTVGTGNSSGTGAASNSREFIPDADPAAIRRLAAYYQAGASPSAATALARANAAMDVRGLLASIRVPTLVVNREHDPVAPGETGKYLAERIPGSRFVQLPGSAHAPWLGDAERFCTEVEHFVTGVRPVEREPGAVRTILHCDIVGSTARAVSLGDERWSELLEIGRAHV